MKTVLQVPARAHGFHGSWEVAWPKASHIHGRQISQPKKQAVMWKDLPRKKTNKQTNPNTHTHTPKHTPESFKKKKKRKIYPNFSFCYQLIENSVFTPVLQNTSL